jgi:phosphate transport system substrate-binding protein
MSVGAGKVGIVAAFTLGMGLFSFAATSAAAIILSETGSTLILPVFKAWVAAYEKVDPNVHITVGATGSQAGIAQAISKRVQIGMSDAYMSDAEAMANPDILNGIYSGSIRNWDAAEIVALNKGVMLPHREIVPLHRADGSGDTFIFTQFLSFSTTDWENRTGYGTTVKWPNVAGALTVTSNQQMVETIGRTPYGVGYLGASWESEADKAGLNSALLLNQDGNFVLPTQSTISAAADTLTPRTPEDERLTLVFAPGKNSYPLINYEYAVVSAKQPNPQIAAAIGKFLLWCLAPQGGNGAVFLNSAHFIALPTPIRALSEMQIAKMLKESGAEPGSGLDHP